MLSDKVYLWMVIAACLALAVATTLCVIEKIELGKDTQITRFVY